MPPSLPNTLEGQIERITFHSPETHFMIAKLRVAESRSLVTVLGHFPEPRPGETLRLKGRWDTHPRYGQQFKVSAFEVLLPAGVEEIRRYLSCGVIKGVGPKTTERLIAHFKKDTLTAMENEPQRLTEVKGIGQDKALRIAQAWREHHAVRALMQFLQDHKLKPAYGAKIYKAYGPEAMEILQNDPYRVARDIPRIGFYIADAIVQRSDLPIDETGRARACLRHLLQEAGEEGHLYISKADLETRCGETFNLGFDAVQDALDDLIEDQQIKLDEQAPGLPVYLQSFYAAETEIAKRLEALLSIPLALPDVDAGEICATVVRRLAIQLSPTQAAVLQSALVQRLVIITGGPGTGKTTIIRSIAAIFEAVGVDYRLAAPTGRAARRMSELTHRPAVTLHKLLGYSPAEGHFEYDQDNPLETGAVVVDEASMVDVLLMGHLVKALPHGARLILVGDVSQLPSVGPGMVLADLIASQVVQAYELTEVFRQAAQSPIIANAHRIRHGMLPEMSPLAAQDPLSEFTFIEQTHPEKIAQTILSLCKTRIPKQLGLDGVRHVQVLTPMHKGPLGTIQLNKLLQAALNPQVDKAAAFSLNDKVMHLRNNYQKEVFNGEIGTVVRLDKAQGRFWVDYDGRQVSYDESDMDELVLAYAISVHKSQGSEYPVIILPMVTQHYVMLQRNLLYTALTRARQMVILVGSAKAVRVAVHTDAPNQRRSLLGWRLNPDIGIGHLVDDETAQID
ncbi:MAG: ATP-dependent RecD-like DNA helicase [Desulfobacteraceae bacterium]|jgi:exodeoxyribonuclease V alpha subunit